jgi:cysteine desulfurase family protein (TIGR01976 family)
VIDAMTGYLVHSNANHGGAFATSERSDAILHEAHAAMADMVNAALPDEIVFGPNMTTLTLSVSRALAREIGPGDEIVVTRMDHDANISPWLLVAEDRGATVRWADFDVEDYTLDMDGLRGLIGDRTRIVAVGYASNALGTVNDVRMIVDWAHEAGALTFIDAVQYAPHGPIDVQALGCDLLVASAYKFFGPHLGVLYGRYDLLDRLRAYKVRPAPDEPPGKFETGTQNHEGIAGTLAAVEYLAEIGQAYGTPYERYFPKLSGRRLHLKTGMSLLRAYDHVLSAVILDELETLPGVQVHGITDRDRMWERVPTVSFTWGDRHPREIAAALGEQGIYVWDGNYYALAVTERLGLEGKGGMVRIGAVHYNTVAEIRRLGDALRTIA